MKTHSFQSGMQCLANEVYVAPEINFHSFVTRNDTLLVVSQNDRYDEEEGEW